MTQDEAENWCKRCGVFHFSRCHHEKDVDPINHPTHYTQGIECADYIQSHGMDFFQGNAVKYLTRFRHKGTPIEDLKKARWYVDRMIEIENERQKNGPEIKDANPEK